MINCRKRESEVLLKERKGEHDYNIDSGDAIAFGVRKSKIRKQGLAQSILATELQRLADTCYYESGESRGRVYNVRSRRGTN